MFEPDLKSYFAEPEEKPQRFGLTLSVLLVAAAFLLRYSIVSFVLCDIALIFFILSLLQPESLVFLQRIFKGIGGFAGKWVSPFMMAVIYFVILTPLSAVRRFVSRKKIDDESYFENALNEHRETDFFERPY